MSKTALPPRGIFIPTRVAFHPHMPVRVRDTLIQLIGLAWENDGRNTPYCTYTELSDLTGKAISTLREHISLLQNDFDALHSESAGDGTFCFIFSKWVVPIYRYPAANSKNQRPPDSENLEYQPIPDSENSESVDHDLKDLEDLNDFKDLKEEEEDSSSSSLTSSSSSLKMGDQKRGSFSKKEASKNKPMLPLTAELRQALLDAGLFEHLLDEVAAAGMSETQIRALLEWTLEKYPQESAGLIMYRVRHHILPPREYFTPPCHRCGQRRGHAQNCPERYDEDYARSLES